MMTALENLATGIGSVNAACSIATLIVAVACRDNPWMCFIALISTIATASIATGAFHFGGLF
jgi:hypothetical protein